MPKLITMKDPNFNPLQNYIIDKTIGQGTFGKVKLGIHKATGEKVAIKILEKQRIENENDFTRVQREIHILRKIRHPNIIQLYEIIESEVKLYLIMEYASGGELFEYIVSRQRLAERDAGRIFYQLINSIEYLHNIGIVHRDLKPENILLNHASQIKVVDFGLSTLYKQNQKLHTPCGSPCYAAPEMVSGLPYEGLKTDLWSAGIILYAMICGCVPFEDPNTKMLYEKIKTHDFALPKGVSPQAQDLLRRILQKDPHKRISIGEIRRHDFMLLQGKITIPKGVNTKLDNFQALIEIDDIILEKVCQLDVDKDEAIQMIKNNKHNCITTTYYLLISQYQREYPLYKEQYLMTQVNNQMKQRQISHSQESNQQQTTQNFHQKEQKEDPKTIQFKSVKQQKQQPVPETGGSSSLERIVAKSISERLYGKTKSQEPVINRDKSQQKHSQVLNRNQRGVYEPPQKSTLTSMLIQQFNKTQKMTTNAESATYVRTRSNGKTIKQSTERTDRPSSNSQRSSELTKRSVEKQDMQSQKEIRQYRLMSTYNIEGYQQARPIQTQPNERISVPSQQYKTDIGSSQIKPIDYTLGIQIYKNNLQNRFLIKKQQQKRLSKQ
ncbi:hypothetical protein pb186bvf_012566 [Paramecium bursaria]